MSVEQPHADHNVDGILQIVQDYLELRKKHVIRLNPEHATVIDEVLWTQTENLRQVLLKQKGFGADRIRVADVLAGEDEMKRKSLFSFSDQNSILWEIINKSDDKQTRVAELPIHDQVTFFRAISPALESLVRLVQHWIYWDLPDAVDLLHFEDQVRRINALLAMQITDDIRSRYKTAMRKRPEDSLTDADIYHAELKRLESAVTRFIVRRTEEEAFQKVIARGEPADGEEEGAPYDYKKMQCKQLRDTYEAEHAHVEEKIRGDAPAHMEA